MSSFAAFCESAKPAAAAASASVAAPTAADRDDMIQQPAHDDPLETMAMLLRRHKAERKAQRKSNNALLSGKKGAARAAAEGEIAAANEALATRHAKEKAAREAAPSAATGDTATSGATNGGGGSAGDAHGGAASAAPRQKKKTKAQRRKERKARDAKAREGAIAAEKAAAGPTDKEVETGLIAAKLAALSLAIKPVAADGHCLYRAVLDQLEATGAPHRGKYPQTERGLKALRRDVSGLMRRDAARFAPFLVLEDGDTYEEYCARVADTADWGGQPELLALSLLLGVPIDVFKANAPVLKMGAAAGGDGSSARLRLSFHEHYYALGEHYNSVRGINDGGGALSTTHQR